MSLIALLFWSVVLPLSGILFFLTYADLNFRRKCRAKGIPYLGVEPLRFLQFLTGFLSLPEMELILYSRLTATGKRVAGFNDAFANLAYLVNDLDLTRHIYVKDFDHLGGRRKFEKTDDDDMLQKMLIVSEGHHWKGLRSKLSPAFTTGKLRRMFHIFETSSQKMCQYLRKCGVGNNSGDVVVGGEGTDICEAFSKYAMNVTASCAFGVESQAFDTGTGELSKFEKMAKKLSLKLDPLSFLKLIFFFVAPSLAKRCGVSPFEKSSQEYFNKVVLEVMKRRRESGQRKDDFLQLMMDLQQGLLKEEENSKEALEVMRGSAEGEGGASSSLAQSEKNNVSSTKIPFGDDIIAANCVMFLFGGFDTTQSLLIFAAYALALEQDVQEKLFQEVKAAYEENEGKLEYEQLIQMQYLDLFINETLRYFPPRARTERLWTKDYKVPGMDLLIEKGSMVSMPVMGMQRDPTVYTNPEKFEPERFLPKRKGQRHPYSFAPFGHGPRNCIAMRFALMEVKTVIASLVYNFKLEPASKTDIPMKFQNHVSLKPANGLWLQVKSRK